LLVNDIQRGLAQGGRLTRLGVGALQALDASQRNYDSSMAGHAVQARGQNLNYDSSMYGHQTQAGLGAIQREIQLQQLQRELGKDRAERADKNDRLSPYVVSNKPDGTPFVDDAKVAALRQFRSAAKYAPDASHPQGRSYDELNADERAQVDKQFALQQFVADHFKDSTFAHNMPPGTVKFHGNGVEDEELRDAVRGSGAVALIPNLAKPGNLTKSVAFNVNGTKQTVPLYKFISGPQGAANLEMLNEWRASKKLPLISPNNLTGVN
jgi:hypothetical protein